MTNSHYLNKLEDDLLKPLKQIQITMYGYNKETYEIYTGIADGYKFLAKAIEKVNKNNIPTITSVILDKNNSNKIEEYIISAIQIGIPNLAFGITVPTGRAIKNKDEFLLSKNELIQLYTDIELLRNQYVGKISILPFQDFQSIKALNANQFGCGAGTSNLVISEEGFVRPCLMMPGNVF